jgi:hypothetical protein
MPLGFWKFLQLLFSLSFVACVMSAYWNVLAARRVEDWGRRTALFTRNQRVTLRFGLISVLLVGVFGHLASLSLGLTLANDRWLSSFDVLCLAALIVMSLVELPASRALVREARRAIHDGPTAAFDRALRRWRIGNSALRLLAAVTIGWMVFRWRS